MKQYSGYLIVPAWSDQAGYCRIVHVYISEKMDLLQLYRKHPDLFTEVGRMDSSGRVVYLDCTKDELEDIRSCEPLMASTQFFYE